MRRTTLVAALVFVLFSIPRPAEALWCSSDPVYTFNGVITDITTNIPLEYMLYVNGPVSYKLQTPPTVVRRLLINDVGFNLHGITTNYLNRTGGVNGKSFLLTASVVIPFDSKKLPVGVKIPTQLTIYPLNGKPTTINTINGVASLSVWITGP